MNKVVKKSLKVAAIVLGVLLALIIGAVIFIAYKGGDIAKAYLEEHDQELIGRELTIGKIDLSLLHGTVSADSVNLKEKDEKTDFVKFDTLFVDMKLTDLLSHKVTLEHIHLTGADVEVLQRDSVFNFTDIIEHFSKKDTTEAEPADTTPSQWEVGLYDIQLRRCAALYKDLVLNSKFDLRNINIDIPGLYFSNKSTDVGLNLAFENGGSLAAKMKYAMESSDFEINAKVKGFSIAGIKPYMQQGVRVGSVSGLLDVDATMKGDFNHIMNFTLSGNSSLRNVKVTDDRGRLVMSAKRTSAELVRLNLTDNEIHLGTIDGEGIASQFLIDKNGNDNISYFVASPQAEERHERKDSIAEAQGKKVEEKPLKFLIDKVDMKGMSMYMEDASLKEKFTYQVKDFSVKASNVTLDKPNDVTIAGRLGKTGSVNAHWKGSLDAMNNQNLSATLTNVDLTEFTPYFDPIFAYRITGGNMTMISQNIIENGNLKGSNMLSVMNCTVEKDKTVENPEVKAPLKTALYIIKDKDGKISIDLPISGNINSPEFNYKKIITKTLLNFLAKVGTSPFKSLAHIFGSSDNANEAKLNPTNGNLEIETYDLLNKVVSMIKDKPALKATLDQQINYEDAIPDMALLKLKTAYYLKQNPGKTEANLEIIDQDAISKIEEKDDEFKAYAASVSTSGETKPLKVAVELYGTSAQTELNQLAVKRSSAINTFLTQQVGDKANNITLKADPYNAETKYSGKSILKLDLVEE